MINLFKILGLTTTDTIEKRKILFFVGAGISEESGLKTFRDDNGLWNQYKVSDICDIRSFHKNKELIFDFYNERKKEILSKEPNEAHFLLAKIQKKYGAENVFISTSNIDNLLEKAGCQNVLHVHGDIFTIKCLDCESIFKIGERPYNTRWKCQKCDSHSLKPNIVFFGESAPKYQKLKDEFSKIYKIENNQTFYNLKIIIGTSFQVIKPEVFRLDKCPSLLVDKNPDAKYHPYFQKIIVNQATSSIEQILEFINNTY